MGNRKFFPREFPGEGLLVKYHFDQIYKAESRFLSIFGLYVTCNMDNIKSKLIFFKQNIFLNDKNYDERLYFFQSI